MTPKKKLVKIKKKIAEHPIASTLIAAAVPTYVGILAVTYLKTSLNANDRRLKEALTHIAEINSAIREMKETGKAVSFHDQNGNPLFDVTPPDED